MAIKKTYGVNFPFRESTDGTYLDLTENVPEEVRADLLHLILTRKGSRYYYLILELEYMSLFLNLWTDLHLTQ